MAFFNQDMKKELAPSIQAICKKFGIKASIAVRHHSTLVLNIKSGKIDFDDSKGDFHYQVNQYHIKNHFSGKSCEFLSEVYSAMMVGNHDNSDIMTDYFDIGFFIDINIGQYEKPYVLVKN